MADRFLGAVIGAVFALIAAGMFIFARSESLYGESKVGIVVTRIVSALIFVASVLAVVSAITNRF